MLSGSTDVRSWRPQRFGRRSARHVDDPLVEPLWSGIRVLAHVTAAATDMLDGDGGVQDWPDVAADLVRAIQADEVILDGYLTTEASGEGVGAYTGSSGDAASPAAMVRQLLWFGGSGRSRKAELVEALEAEAPRPFTPGEDVAFVVVDMLAVDGVPLLDVPLLERKRLLESVLVEGDRVRRGIHVRPPVDVWLTTWRTLGFRSLAYKDANSRYRPGEPNDDWARAQIPHR